MIVAAIVVSALVQAYTVYVLSRAYQHLQRIGALEQARDSHNRRLERVEGKLDELVPRSSRPRASWSGRHDTIKLDGGTP